MDKNLFFISYQFVAQNGEIGMGSCFTEMDTNIDTLKKVQDIQVSIVNSQTPPFKKAAIMNFQKITDDKKPFFLRHSDGETFVIPSEKVQEFDVLQEQIESCEEYSDFSYELNSRFDELYGGYKMEGNLYHTKFYLDKHPNLLF